MGNPFLKPQYSTNYELMYSYKSAFSIGFDYNYISDYQVEYDGQKGNIFYATTVNLGHREHMAIELNLALSPVKWWNFNLNSELDFNTYQGQLPGSFLNVKTTYLYLYDNNQFNLSHGWSAELSVFYLSPSVDAQFTHIVREQTNIGLQKKILKNKGSVKLGARDIFRGNFSGGYITNVPGVIATYHNDNANRSVTLGFTYNFGSNNNTKKRDTGSADSEAGRVRN